MKITVKIGPILQRQSGLPAEQEVEIDRGITLGNALDKIGMNPETNPMISVAVIDDRECGIEYALQGGETVHMVGSFV